MSSLQKKVAAAVAAGSLLLQVATPLMASTTSLEITGNGRDSNNDINLNLENATTVVQSNEADIKNEVKVEANTGGNEAEDNIGGDVEIDTGDVDVSSTVKNTANSNVADVDGCCDMDAEVTIEGNAAKTDNNADLELGTAINVFQDNDSDVKNETKVYANTGDNEAEDNIGGSVKITTGDVDVSADYTNELNSNSAVVGGGGGLSLSARILGNGRESDNDIDLDLERAITLVQSNEADVENEVEVDANTGDNEAEDNIGGDVMIDTGDVKVAADFDTIANFNYADVDCDCLADIDAKIAWNLKDSDNTIEADLGSALTAFQGNCSEEGAQAGDLGDGYRGYNGDCEWENEVEVGANTGGNEAEDNGGELDADPSVETGDVDVTADFTNEGNSNVYGEGAPEGWGLSLPGGLYLQLRLDLGDLLGLLG
jgi:hypothetical protein